MTTEENVLVRWSMDITEIGSGISFRQKSRIALAELFTGFARSLLDAKDIDLVTNHEIELSIASEHLNQKLVLRLIKMDIAEEKT